MYFFFLVQLFQFAYVADARNGPGDYWKSVMNGETMPKAITDLVHQNPASDSDKKTDRFIRNFDTKANVIIYHSHDHIHNSEKPNPSAVND